MMRNFIILLFLIVLGHSIKGQSSNTDLESITIGDPFIFADIKTKTYYLFGTNERHGMWYSKDLKTWHGPLQYLEWDKSSWIGDNPSIWAPEIHLYKGNYYCFVTFTNNDSIRGVVNGRKLVRRDTYILKGKTPAGPYKEFCSKDYLDGNKCTLDGTLWIERGTPYMIYCYEWIQAIDGRMEAVKLNKKISAPKGTPFELFKASDCKWNDDSPVTDGPFLFRTRTGRLGMLWSSGSKSGYSQGVAYSESGTIRGPWVQDTETLTPRDHGHGMLFRTFEGRLLLICHTWHYDNKGKRLTRYPVLFEVDDSGDKLKVIGKYNP